MSHADPIAELTRHFAEGIASPRHDPPHVPDVVVVSWPAVPIEIIRAVGLRPVIARGATLPTPLADDCLERDIFPSRIRQLIEVALNGALAGVSRVVIPRTSDPDYKCFLYLREFVRTGSAPASMPPTMLFDLLQSNAPDVGAYDRARTHALLDALGEASGHPATLDVLRDAIVQTNAARAAARRLLALREGAPRIVGTAVLPLLGAFWQVEPVRYAELANAAADDLATRPVLSGPRLLVAGAPVDGTSLHAAIEGHGAVVVAEIGPWGTGVAGDDVRCDDDPVAALADKYRADTIGPRLPAASIRHWLDRARTAVDGVVVSLPPDDTVFGWDYPQLRDALDASGIPHARLDGYPDTPLTADEHTRIHDLVTAATRRQEGRCG